MLRIEHLSKAYGEKKAVDDLNLHIAPGEIYGFIGHNGAGKTTTLKSVAGYPAIRRRGKSMWTASPSGPSRWSASGPLPISRITLTCTTT